MDSTQPPSEEFDAPQPPVTIALVDDDRNILATLSIALQAEGYATQPYPDARAALEGLQENPPDLAIFDIKMPQMDGMELLRHLRERSSLPVIFLTSKDEEEDEEAGLAMGADDYISKPFSQRLLLARIRAILRRAAPQTEGARQEDSAGAEEEGRLLRRGRLEMDPSRHLVRWAGEPVSLTVTEFLLLEALAQRPGVIRSRAELMNIAYPDDAFVDDRTIDSHIKRVRRKFRSVAADFSAIETLYGAGYSFSND